MKKWFKQWFFEYEEFIGLMLFFLVMAAMLKGCVLLR